MSRRHIPLLLALLGFTLFAGVAFWRAQLPIKPSLEAGLDRVVISAPILVVLYGGDRFLAADLEVVRLAATGLDDRGVDTGYLVRAQQEVARLNPCHEDNYYLANGLLTWGGAVAEGNRVLEAAVECRFWDYVPPFFYGVNLSFFQRDNAKAARVLEFGAERSPENAAALRKLAIMLQAEQFSDERLVLGYLTQQRDSTSDPKLRGMLNKRVIRIQGLLDLRLAQRRYEKVRGPLQSLQQLLDSGELAKIPDDPLRIGYEIKNGRIELKKLKIAGMEG